MTAQAPVVYVVPIDGVIDLGLAPFVVTEGIDSLSLNPDSRLETMLAIVDLEKRLGQGMPEIAGRGTQASR